MKTQTLIILIGLFSFWGINAQDPMFIKNIYATEIIMKENGDFVKKNEKSYFPTTIIIDAKNRLVTLEHPTDNSPIICKLLEIIVSKEEKHADVYAETPTEKTVLFKIYEENAYFIDAEDNYILLFTNK